MHPRTILDLVGTPIIFKEGVDALGAAPRSKSLSGWFDTKTRGYWTEEFQSFYDSKTGSDIDGSWIDMNEPSSVSSQTVYIEHVLTSTHPVLRLSMRRSILAGEGPESPTSPWLSTTRSQHTHLPEFNYEEETHTDDDLPNTPYATRTRCCTSSIGPPM